MRPLFYRLLFGFGAIAVLIALAAYVKSYDTRSRYLDALREANRPSNGPEPPSASKLRKIAKENPDSPEAQMAYAKQLVREGTFEAETVAALDNAIRLNPTDAECYLMRGKVLEMIRGSEVAALEYEQAARLDPQMTEAMVRRADIAKNHSEWDEAIGWYRRAISVEPGNVTAHTNLGTALTQKGEHTQAIAEFEAALALKPDDGSLMHQIGDAYKRLENSRDARAWYERACNLPRPYTASCRAMKRLDVSQ